MATIIASDPAGDAGITRRCLVDGCTRNTDNRYRGWCESHYKRWRAYSDPLAGGTGMREAQRFYREEVLGYDGTDCLTWPYALSAEGYGKIADADGRSSIVSRRACEDVYGPPPTPEHQAAHSCGNGRLGCVNPRHLSWKTQSDNQMDRVEHGTSNRGERCAHSKLTLDQVRQIRALKGSLSQQKIARQFGVSGTTIHGIFSERIWSWVS